MKAIAFNAGTGFAARTGFAGFGFGGASTGAVCGGEGLAGGLAERTELATKWGPVDEIAKFRWVHLRENLNRKP